MMRIAACLAVLTCLAACGVDGDPERPERTERAAPPGIALSGSVAIGLAN